MELSLIFKNIAPYSYFLPTFSIWSCPLYQQENVLVYYEQGVHKPVRFPLVQEVVVLILIYATWGEDGDAASTFFGGILSNRNSLQSVVSIICAFCHRWRRWCRPCVFVPSSLCADTSSRSAWYPSECGRGMRPFCDRDGHHLCVRISTARVQRVTRLQDGTALRQGGHLGAEEVDIIDDAQRYLTRMDWPRFPRILLNAAAQILRH